MDDCTLSLIAMGADGLWLGWQLCAVWKKPKP